MLDNQLQTQKQNLIERMSSARIVRSRGFYRLITFEALLVITAFCFAYAYRLFLGKTVGLWVVVVLATMFLILSVLAVFFEVNWRRRFFVLILETLAIAGTFYDRGLSTLALTGGLFIVFSVWGELIARGRAKNSLDIKFMSTAKPALNRAIMALSFVAVLIYLPHLNARDIFLSERSFEKVFDWSAGVVGNFFPNVNFTSSFDAFAAGVARLKVQDTAEFAALSAGDQERVVKETAAKFAKDVESQLKIAVDPMKPASNVFYQGVLSLVERWKEKFGSSFSAAWAIIAFLAISSFGAIFAWVIVFLAFLLFELLISFNVVHIGGETRTKEVVEL